MYASSVTVAGACGAADPEPLMSINTVPGRNRFDNPASPVASGLPGYGNTLARPSGPLSHRSPGSLTSAAARPGTLSGQGGGQGREVTRIREPSKNGWGRRGPYHCC